MFPYLFRKFIEYTIVLGGILSLSSCFAVKDYKPGTPFVYKTNIHVEGNLSGSVKKDLEYDLNQRLDDGMRVPIRQKFLIKKTLLKPLTFDTNSVQKSITFMENYLHVSGYYRDSINFKSVVDTVDDQHRVTVDFYVYPGELFKLDSISYKLSQPVNPTPTVDSLQVLTQSSLDQRLIKKGDAFSTNAISNELTRLSAYYRNNGFARFTPELFQVVWDTLGTELLQPFLDPLEQARILEQRRDFPTADIEVRLKEQPDSAKLVRYHVGSVKIFPDFQPGLYGSHPPDLTEEKYDLYSFYRSTNKFLPKKLLPFVHINPGDLYRESDYQKTLNKLSSISAWKEVVIDQVPRNNDDSVDFEIRMVPAKKMKANLALDVTYQQGSIVSSGGNLIGTGASFTFINRNLAKGVNESNTVVRYGIEVSPTLDSIQSHQFVVNYIISFPRLLPKFIVLPKNANDNASSLVSANFATEYRFNYYNIRTTTFYWGARFGWKNVQFNLRFPNIEYNVLRRESGLDTLIKQNASYKYIFNDGLIISGVGDVIFSFDKPRIISTLKIGAEESGLLTGLLHNVFPDAKLYRFIKTEAEYVRVKRIRRSAIAWRLFGGAGFSLPFSTENGKIDSLNFYMPFFRQYQTGGPNSMRGWTVRKLGPGSTIKSFSNEVAPDRFGDMRLEANFEYRYFIAQVFGYTLEGALFVDMGNIWFIRKNNDFVNGEINGSRLWKDIAIGTGTGIRADLGFIKLRLDYSYKAKNPSPDPAHAASQNKWFYDWSVFSGQLHFGIGYPF